MKFCHPELVSGSNRIRFRIKSGMTPKIMQQSKIIIFLIILFLIASAYLFFVDSRDNSLDFQKNWWVIYFDDPESLSWNFSIENHSDKDDFKYEIFDGKNKVGEGNAVIGKGETREIALDQKVGHIESGKITITVSDGVEKKEIYKNFEN
jgi:hypothetical protein